MKRHIAAIIAFVGVLLVTGCTSPRSERLKHHYINLHPAEEHDDDYVEYSMELIEQWQKEEQNEENRYNDNVLVGDWFTPHSAMCPNVFFRKDGTFSMWDWNSEAEKEEYLTGTYKTKGDSVYLHCKNGRTKSFRLWNASKEDNNYYLSLGGGNNGYAYWLVKGN